MGAFRPSHAAYNRRQSSAFNLGPKLRTRSRRQLEPSPESGSRYGVWRGSPTTPKDLTVEWNGATLSWKGNTREILHAHRESRDGTVVLPSTPKAHRGDNGLEDDRET